MTALPINKSLLNFEDDTTRDNFSKLLTFLTNNKKHFMPYLHFDILPSQKLMIKIQAYNNYGSLKDLIYKSNPLNNYSKKYPTGKAKGLHYSLISLYGKQILEALLYLHNHKWYHMHLHTGNIQIDTDGDCVKLTELENFVTGMPIKNEHLLNYAFESFNSSHYLNVKNDYNSSVLSEIFKNNFNVFEKIDIIMFGRVLYEMTTGRELKAPFPDVIEYKEMESNISEVLMAIFNKKSSRVNSSYLYTVPDVGVEELLRMKLFKNFNDDGDDGDDRYKSNKGGKGDRSDKGNAYSNKGYYDNKAEDEKESLLESCSQNGVGFAANMEVEYECGYGYNEGYGSLIKESIFNQSKYLKVKLKAINNYLSKN